jgi:hypothetical protein
MTNIKVLASESSDSETEVFHEDARHYQTTFTKEKKNVPISEISLSD